MSAKSKRIARVLLYIAVYLPHRINLMIPFQYVGLINAKSINPKQLPPAAETHMVEKPP